MNSDSVQIITKNYGKLTKNEKTVADYIFTHFDDAIGMSVHELAQSCSVSSATPVRLAQHLGFDGYREFRLYLVAHRPEHEDIILDIKETKGLFRESVEKLLNSEIDSIRLTMKEFDYTVGCDIAEKIKNANRILFFGLGSSYLVCQDCANKFQRVGKTVHHSNDITMSAVMLSAFGPSDIVFGISHSGETPDTAKILSLASKLGIFCVAVTTFADSTVCENADKIIYTQTRESPLHRISLSSRIGQLASMDSLFMTYFSLDYENCIRYIEAAVENTKF